MADKTATATLGVAPAVVTEAGTVAAGTCTFIFDEADEMQLVLDNLEKCKIAVLDYYSDGLP